MYYIEHNKIYVASLLDYNCGNLHGVWIDLLDIDCEEDLYTAVAKMLAASPASARGWGQAEDYAIHDYEGFAGFEIGKNAGLDAVYDAHLALL